MCLKSFSRVCFCLWTSTPMSEVTIFLNQGFSISNILFLTLRILIITNSGSDLTETETWLHSFIDRGKFLVVGTVNNIALFFQDINNGSVGPLTVCRKNTKANMFSTSWFLMGMNPGTWRKYQHLFFGTKPSRQEWSYFRPQQSNAW